MKFTVTMKDPDTLHDAIEVAVGIEVADLPLSADEREAVAEKRCEAASEVCRRWFGYGEYLIVEIDTEAGTATVLDWKD